jgi:putative transposase
MRKPRFSDAFILEVLRSVEGGATVRAACRQYRISEQTYHRWKSKYANVEMSESHRLQQILEENRRLRSLVADLTIDNQALVSVLAQQQGAVDWA